MKPFPPFFRYIGLTAGVFLIVALAFALYVWSEKHVDHANDLRHHSYLLAEELRQSSDDLTRMARTYVVTGDPLYKRNYQAILDIREGRMPRPTGYQYIYWDLLPADRQAPASGQAVALLELMRQADFSDDELRQLSEAKTESDALTATEFEAMALIGLRAETDGPEGEADRSRARLMLFDESYHQAKAAIMKPIGELHQQMDARTLAAVESAKRTALLLRIVLIAFALSLVLTLVRARRFLRATLGGSADDVHSHIARIGRGDFSSAIPGSESRPNSVLGWLAKTQNNLQAIDLARRQAEEVSQDALRFQQALMDAVPSPIFYKDARRVYLGGNRAFERYLGQAPEQFIGKTVHDLAPAHLAAIYDHADRDLLDHPGVQSYEAAIVYADGSEHDVIFNKATFSDSTGSVAGLIGVILDISERKRVEEALRVNIERLTELNHQLEDTQSQLLQSEKLASMGQLAAGVAHEINNPIGFIGSNLCSLKGQVDDLLTVLEAYRRAEPALADAPAHLLNAIERAKSAADLDFLRGDMGKLIDESLDGVHRVKTIVENLKDFSRVDKGEWQLANLESGLESTLNIAWNEIKYKAEVSRDYLGLPEIECIPAQLNQVFLNLMINAAHAIDERGIITLRTGFDENRVWVEVADNGKGIRPEHLNKIFEPFFTTKPLGQGTGLGLSLAYGIIQRHHGRLEVRSELGKGTVFRVTLPRVRVIVA